MACWESILHEEVERVKTHHWQRKKLIQKLIECLLVVEAMCGFLFPCFPLSLFCIQLRSCNQKNWQLSFENHKLQSILRESESLHLSLTHSQRKREREREASTNNVNSLPLSLSYTHTQTYLHFHNRIESSLKGGGSGGLWLKWDAWKTEVFKADLKSQWKLSFGSLKFKMGFCWIWWPSKLWEWFYIGSSSQRRPCDPSSLFPTFISLYSNLSSL